MAKAKKVKRTKIAEFTGREFWARFDAERAANPDGTAQLNVFDRSGSIDVGVSAALAGGSGKLGYFEGAKFWNQFDAQRAEYAGDDAQMNVWTSDKGLWVAVCELGGTGDPINESHPCPGSPGCT
jgi:hypothetical protein